MKDKTKQSNSLLMDIWSSYRSLPLWVQIWSAILLFPINMASLFFLNEPKGVLIALLAIIAMLPNILIMIYERGFSKMMALPHVLPWTILVIVILFARPEASGAYNIYLWILLVADVISLPFDYMDSVKWLKGDRAVAR